MTKTSECKNTAVFIDFLVCVLDITVNGVSYHKGNAHNVPLGGACLFPR